MNRIESEIETFRQYLDQTSVGKLQCEKLCRDVMQLIPPVVKRELPPNKESGLTLMAVTHGNEVGGIAVLNQLLELIDSGLIVLNYPLTIGLGNTEASLLDKRFVERDLNRSFMRQQSDSLEDRRARELEPVLQKTAFFVDIHQTIEASSTPFLIFPYLPSSFEFARQIAPDLPIVTHWGGGFSKDGACTDEFVNKTGGVGLTIELGQKGFANYQEGVGLRAMLRALMVVDQRLAGQTWQVAEESAEIYTWAEVIPYPEGEAGLDEGWYNFKRVEKGQRLGFAQGQDILAGTSGPILFPKYPQSPEEPRPKEICRIMKRVTIDQLGKT
ncbi:MAG: succinylglutamate desuccinylase [Oligoflexus sp.]